MQSGLLSRVVNAAFTHLFPSRPADAVELQEKRFGDVLTHFWRIRWSRLNASTTRQIDTYLRVYIRPEFDDLRISEIKRDRVRDWHARHGDRPYMANRALKAARCCFSEMFPDIVNPFERIKLFPERERTRRFSDDERERWLASLHTLHANGELTSVMRDVLYVLRYTAARKMEVCKLRRDQIDLKSMVALIEDHKTDDTESTRVIQLEAVIDVIARRVAVCERDGTRFLFPSRGASGHIVNISSAWKRVCEHAGLVKTRDLVPHLLRGDFASEALGAGEELRVIQRVLGHKDIKTTAKYARCNNDTARRAASRTAVKMGARLPGGAA